MVSRRRAAARRRRRSLLAAAVAVAVVVGVVLVAPLARKAVNDLSLPLQYQSLIRRQAAAKHLDPALVAAVIYAETKFDPRTSSAGAEGLMQILPQTAEYLAHRSGATTFTTADLGTPQVNIAYGSYYLRYLMDEYHGSTVLALAAYNGGEANVDHWIAQAHARGQRLTIARIPFPETRAYVQRVLQARGSYRRTYASQLGYG
jgi:soluble lytic murein transglycosylase